MQNTIKNKHAPKFSKIGNFCVRLAWRFCTDKTSMLSGRKVTDFRKFPKTFVFNGISHFWSIWFSFCTWQWLNFEFLDPRLITNFWPPNDHFGGTLPPLLPCHFGPKKWKTPHRSALAYRTFEGVPKMRLRTITVIWKVRSWREVGVLLLLLLENKVG